MIRKTQPLRISLLVAIAGMALLASCKKDPVDVNPSGTTTATNGYVDNWILANMRYFYYWADKIPASVDTMQAPDKLFYSILYDYTNTANAQRDRFSWIQESATDLKALLSGQTTTAGFDFSLLLRAQGSTDVIGEVLYVLPGSPADKAGMKRGDIFYSVNGTPLTTTNYNTVLNDNSTTQAYGYVTVQNGALVNSTTTKSVTPVVFQENPVFKDSVYTDGTRKIGYLMYNQFVPGPNGSTAAQYDNQLVSIFGKFKAQGVNEMVLDLRYNGGGSVASSTLLGSLLVKGLAGQTKVPYVHTVYNPQVTKDILADPQSGGNDFFYDYFIPQSNNIGDQLTRLYVLTTDRTASASELIINGLRPFMTVNTIGETSYGKNVGSITITDDNNSKNLWGMQPIVFRSYNKNNESDYYNGFTPTVAIDELSYALVPIGDTRDPLLAAAIGNMKGLTAGGRIGSLGKATVVGSSLDRKAGGRNMFVNIPQTLKSKLVH